jgi:hypothetical protein
MPSRVDDVKYRIPIFGTIEFARKGDWARRDRLNGQCGAILRDQVTAVISSAKRTLTSAASPGRECSSIRGARLQELLRGALRVPKNWSRRDTQIDRGSQRDHQSRS